MKIIRETTAEGRAFKIAVKRLENIETRIGWKDTSQYEDGTLVAEAAAMNEFGYPQKHVPARPFIRPAVSEKKQSWITQIEAGVKAVLKNKATVSQVMENAGKTVIGDIQKNIAALKNPKLSDVTIYRRLHRKYDKKTVGALDKPLIDTGTMFTTLTQEVTKK